MIEWRRRDERKLVGWVLAFMLSVLAVLMLFPAPLYAGGLQASFGGSRFDCPDDPSVVACYKGVVDGSNNLIDFSENLLARRTQFDNWTQTGTCAVTADQWRNPVDGALDADYLDNTGGANTDHRYLYTTSSTSNEHTGSVWVRVDTPHNVTVVLNENGVGAVDTNTFAATTNWRRIPVSGFGTGVGAIGLLLYPGENGTATGQAYFYGAQIIENDEFRTGMGFFVNPTDQTITKPALDLAQTNNPTAARAHLQMSGGNKGPAREFNGTNEYYSKAHHASMNINDADHTYTIIYRDDSDGTGVLFSHGLWHSDGLYIQRDNALDRYTVSYHNNGAGMPVYSASNLSVVDQYHIMQIVCDSNTSTAYLDDDAGTPVDVTGYGIDGARSFYIGVYNGGGANWWDGDVSGVVIRSRALSTDELAEEREMILGTYTNWSDVNQWDFSRSTTAYKTFSAGGANALVSHMSEVAVDHPRVAGKGSGLLIEGQSTNLLEYSQQFQQAGSWSPFQSSVVADSAIALDGTTSVDTLHENAVAAVSHWIQQGFNVTNASTYTFSVYVEPINRDWFALYDSQTGATVYGNAANCAIGTVVGGGTGSVEPGPVCRYSMTWTASATAATTVSIFIAEADNDVVFNGLDQDSLYVWQAQVEEMPFPTSPILTTTAPVTRTADDMTLDPHPAGTNEWVLPLSFTPTGPASKLTFYGEFKCQWSGAADIGGVNRMLFSISGNTGAGERQADNAHNRVSIYVNDTGDLGVGMVDSGGTDHMATTVVDPVDYSEWFSIRAFFDLADFSRMSLWMQQCPGECYASGEQDAANAYLNNDGTGNFYTDDTEIRNGQWWNGDINGHCKVRNLRICPEEIRP